MSDQVQPQANAQPIVVMADKNGHQYDVPQDQVQVAQQTYNLRPQSDIDQEQEHNAAVEGKNEPGFQEGDVLDTLANNFLSTTSLGLTDIAQKYLDDRSPETKQIVAERRQKSEEEAPVSSLAASGAGLAGSVLATGGGALPTIGKAALPNVAKIVGEPVASAVTNAVTKALGTSTAAKAATTIAGAMAKNTAIAGAYNTPSMVANLATGDPQTAAETLGATLTYGPLLGLGGLALGGAATKLGGKISSYTEAAADKAVNAAEDAGDIGTMFNKANKYNKITEPAIESVKNAVAAADETIKKNKDEVDGQFDRLTQPDVGKATDTELDVATKLGTANQSQVNPTQPFVNPANVSKAFDVDAIKPNSNAIDHPIYNQIKGVFADSGSNQITHEATDALRENLNKLEDHPLKDLALQHLDDTQARSLDAANAQLGAEKNALYELNKSKIVADAASAEEDNTPKRGNGLVTAGLALHGNIFGAALNHRFGATTWRGIASKLSSFLPEGMIKTISKIADEAPHLVGATLARSLNEAMDSEMAKIPSILAQAGTAAVARQNPLNSILGGGSGLTENQKYNKVTQAVTYAQANPDSISENYGNLLALFGSDPHLQNLIAQHNTKALSYINSIVPRNTNPPQPFSKNDWEATGQQKADFLNQLKIVDNPMYIIHKIADGSATTKDLTTLRAVYPALAAKMMGEITKYAFSEAGVNAPAHVKHAIVRTGAVSLPSTSSVNLGRQEASWAPLPQNNESSAQPARHKSAGGYKHGSLQTNTGRLSNK